MVGSENGREGGEPAPLGVRSNRRKGDKKKSLRKEAAANIGTAHITTAHANGAGVKGEARHTRDKSMQKKRPISKRKGTLVWPGKSGRQEIRGGRSKGERKGRNITKGKPKKKEK